MIREYLSKGGRKLFGFVVAVAGMTIVAFGAYGLVGLADFDSSFATGIVIAVCSGIGTLYATFVGGNYGEHVAKSKASQQESTSEDPLKED
jgi:hypothetical protein